MIAKLTGVVEERLDDAVIVGIAGVGYEVFVTTDDLGAARTGESASFYIYEQIREDAHNLYGFRVLAAKQLFVQLIGISGIGPKVAMAVLSATSIDRLKQAIVAGDPELLRGVSGVGKKTAERIIIELRGKVDGLAGGLTSSTDPAYQALVGLGYSAAQAAEAVAGLPAVLVDDQARIKAALQGLAR